MINRTIKYKIMKKNIKFENAQELKKQYPDTFYAPEPEELQQLKPGDTVKVCACQERFWAEIVAIDDGMVTARVDNHLLMRQLRYNDLIAFHLDNVYNIFPRNVQQQNHTLKVKSGAKKDRSKRKGL